MIKNVEELKELLKLYRGILNKEMIEYLESIIELEFSVVKEYLSETDRTSLSELLIYKEAANYNIINRSKKILSEIDEKVVFQLNPNLENLKAYYDKVKVFKFNYGKDATQERRISHIRDNTSFGLIELYNYDDDILSNFYNSLLEDYGLDESDFTSSNDFSNHLLQKNIKVKKMPNLIIKSTTTYL